MVSTDARPLHFIGSSHKDLSNMPEDVRSEAGYALYLAQLGDAHPKAKSLGGFGGASVLEAVLDESGDTYRAVYTVRFAHAVYLLHAFQKKSKRGSETPRSDIELIKRRLAVAAEHYRANYEERNRGKL
jgi:phage-related protein